MATLYAKIAGIAVLLLALIGLLAGEGPLLAVVNIEIVEDIVHVLTGGLLVYAGFAARPALTRSIVGGIGVVYLLVGLLGFVAPMLFGLLPEYGYSVVDNLLHLVLGVLALVAARSDAPARSTA